MARGAKFFLKGMVITQAEFLDIYMVIFTSKADYEANKYKAMRSTLQDKYCFYRQSRSIVVWFLSEHSLPLSKLELIQIKICSFSDFRLAKNPQEISSGRGCILLLGNKVGNNAQDSTLSRRVCSHQTSHGYCQVEGFVFQIPHCFLTQLSPPTLLGVPL